MIFISVANLYSYRIENMNNQIIKPKLCHTLTPDPRLWICMRVKLKQMNHTTQVCIKLIMSTVYDALILIIIHAQSLYMKVGDNDLTSAL